MSWFNRKKQLPTFTALNNFEHRDSYFVRCAHWRWLNERDIAVTDPNGPRILTLDPWPQIIFLAADGLKTVAEYVHLVSSKYKGSVPENLDRTVIHELNTLLMYGIIQMNIEAGRPDQEYDKAN